jgi:hypothetical protein
MYRTIGQVDNGDAANGTDSGAQKPTVATQRKHPYSSTDGDFADYATIAQIDMQDDSTVFERDIGRLPCIPDRDVDGVVAAR